MLHPPQRPQSIKLIGKMAVRFADDPVGNGVPGKKQQLILNAFVEMCKPANL